MEWFLKHLLKKTICKVSENKGMQKQSGKLSTGEHGNNTNNSNGNENS